MFPVSGPRASWTALVPPFVLGALLRLAGLTRQSFWVDEILTLRGASVGEPFRWHDVLVNPQGPFPHVLLRIWIELFGTSDLALRAWAATAGILALGVGIWLARNLLPRGAVFAAWLFALSPFQIWYAQEVRNYAFLGLFALAAVATFLGAWERGGMLRWLAHGASLTGMLLSNLSGLFLLPVLGLFAVVQKPRCAVPWGGAALAALLLVSPWLRAEFGSHVAWDALAGAEEPVAVRGDLTFHPAGPAFAAATFVGGFGLTPPVRALHEDTSIRVLRPHLPMLLAACLATLCCFGATWKRRGDPATRFLWLWAFLPLALAAGVAILGLKAFNPRYAAVAQPAWILLLGLGAGIIAAKRSGWGWAVGFVLVAVMLHGWGRQALDPAYARDDFRGAARFLSDRAQPGDLILEQGVTGPLERYLTDRSNLRTFYRGDFTRPPGGEGRLDLLLEGQERVWWVGCRLWLEDPDARLLGWIEARGTPIGSWDGPGVRVRGFALEAPR